MTEKREPSLSDHEINHLRHAVVFWEDCVCSKAFHDAEKLAETTDELVRAAPRMLKEIIRLKRKLRDVLNPVKGVDVPEPDRGLRYNESKLENNPDYLEGFSHGYALCEHELDVNEMVDP
jgi:hypothetical protein